MTWQTVRQNYKLPLFLGIGISVVAVLFSALFNKFSDQLSPFIDMIPPGMKAVVGDLAIGTTPEGWLSIELFPLVAMVGVVITAIILGAGVIGREEDSGTLELLLASRRTRVMIVLQKYAAMAGLLVIPPVLLCMTIALIGPLFDFHPNLTHVAGACVSLWFLGLSFGSLTFTTQAVTGKRGLAVGVGSLMFLVMYALSITAKLIESWKDYNVWSLIHYYTLLQHPRYFDGRVGLRKIGRFSLCEFGGTRRGADRILSARHGGVIGRLPLYDLAYICLMISRNRVGIF